MTSDSFNPYRTWLGIPAQEQPADYYRLLGVMKFENDREVIENAADMRMAHVRSLQTGQRGKLSQQILNELSAARICLLNSQRKAEYDERLRAEADLDSRAKPPLKTKPVDPRVHALKSPVPNPIALPVRAATVMESPESAPVPLLSRLPRWALPSIVAGAGLALITVFAVVLIAVSGRDAQSAHRSGAHRSTTSTPHAVGNETRVKVRDNIPDKIPPQSETPNQAQRPTAIPSRPKRDPAISKPPPATPPTEPAPLANATNVDLQEADRLAADQTIEIRPASSKTKKTDVTAERNKTKHSKDIQRELQESAPPAPFEGSVLRFYGHTFAEIANSRELVDFTRPLTIECWVRLDGERWNYWIAGNRWFERVGKGIRHLGWAIYVGKSGRGIQLNVYGTGLPAYDLTGKPDAWYHVAICGDGKRLSLFINGKPIGTAGARGPLPSPRKIYLGRVPNLDHVIPEYVPKRFKGDLHAFSISSTPRYTKSFQPSKRIPRDDKTQVYLVLNGGMSDTVSDLSGNGHHTVVHNGSWVATNRPKRP